VFFIVRFMSALKKIAMKGVPVNQTFVSGLIKKNSQHII